jgi:hypothetical protein
MVIYLGMFISYSYTSQPETSTNKVMWDPMKNANRNHNEVLWVAFYLQSKSVFSLVTDYLICNSNRFIKYLVVLDW